MDSRIQPRSTRAPTTGRRYAASVEAWSFTDYLINAIFPVIELRRTRERRLDIRSIVGPMALVVFVATHYVRTLPTGGPGRALALTWTLGGLSLGVLCGTPHTCSSTRTARGSFVSVPSRPSCSWQASAPPVFVFAMEHGAWPAIRDFSIIHHISAAAWPIALVSMALCEVTARLVIVQVRDQQLVSRTRRGARDRPTKK